MANEGESRRNPDEIGSLWLKNGAKGDFLSGEIRTEDGQVIRVVCFRNDRKRSDREPEWRILKSRDNRQGQGGGSQGGRGDDRGGYNQNTERLEPNAQAAQRAADAELRRGGQQGARQPAKQDDLGWGGREPGADDDIGF